MLHTPTRWPILAWFLVRRPPGAVQPLGHLPGWCIRRVEGTGVMSPPGAEQSASHLGSWCIQRKEGTDVMSPYHYMRF